MTEPVVSRRQLLARTAAVALPASLAAACGTSRPDALARMRRAGYARIGIADEPPFGYSETGGHVTGYAVEAARMAFSALGVPRIVGVVTDFQLLIDGVRAGAFDVIGAGLFIVPERCERVAFSMPLYSARQAFAVPQDNPLDLRDFEDVARDRRARLGALAGAVEVGHARDAGIPEQRVTTFPSRLAMRAALEAGTIDAAALTTISVRRLIAEGREPRRFAMAPPFTPPGSAASGMSGALAFRRADKSLRRSVDEQLLRLHRSGALTELGLRFGLTAGEVRSARSQRAADLCRPSG